MTAAPFRPSAAQLALMFNNFLMWGGFFMIIPLVTVHFVSQLGWAAASVGLVLGVRQLTQQGLTVFGGAYADRIGPRPLIAAGLFTRSLGFACMGLSTTFWTLLASAVLAGVGGSLFDAPKNAAVTALTSPQDRSRVYSLMGVAGNLGMVTGPLVGAWLSRYEFRTVALLAACAYLIALAVLLAVVPRVPGSLGAESGFAGLWQAVRDTPFRRFTVAMSGYFLLSTQINVAVTLKAVSLYGPQATGPLYGIQAGLAVLLQYPLLRAAERFLSQRQVLVLGVMLASLALGLMSLTTTFVQLLACTVLFSLGTMLVFPTQQSLTALMSPAGRYGSYFGFGALSLGIGGGVGSVVGGALVDVGQQLQRPALPWLTLMLIGLGTALALRWVLWSGPVVAEQSNAQD
ncbi:MFS transporter [Deinococcus sonorensis]|uniref:MFS transporter n=2 Tax=Deinococcus sonorensis TaxID=309891 RepID=A0AAU7U7J9_9DEIO